jgi:hypothetical protein
VIERTGAFNIFQNLAKAAGDPLPPILYSEFVKSLSPPQGFRASTSGTLLYVIQKAGRSVKLKFHPVAIGPGWRANNSQDESIHSTIVEKLLITSGTVHFRILFLMSMALIALNLNKSSTQISVNTSAMSDL